MAHLGGVWTRAEGGAGPRGRDRADGAGGESGHVVALSERRAVASAQLCVL